MAATLAATDRPILGYVSSPAVDRRDTHLSATPPYPDAGVAPDIEPLLTSGVSADSLGSTGYWSITTWRRPC